MPETILVVEYEPRYNDRVRQALLGQPLVPTFAKDGEEALRALAASPPRLIVLSSVIPRISTSDLIRTIRALPAHSTTPILVTVSGYSGKNTRADAARFGASDLLPKPYSDAEFMQKVRDLLGLPPSQSGPFESTTESELTVQYPRAQLPGPDPGAASTVQLTSSEIFGEILDDHPQAEEKKPRRPSDDLDKILADTLSGVRPGKKRTLETERPPVVAPPHRPSVSETRARSSADIDRLLHDTLSGLEKGKQKVPHDPAPRSPAPSPAAVGPAPAVSPSSSPASPASPSASTPVAQPLPLRPPVSMPGPAQAVPSPAPLPREGEGEDDDEGIHFGQYLLLERIATGGMAEVWKARMRGVEGFQKTVAIKKILPHLSDNDEFIEMFVDEAKLAAQLNHSNIIHIYDLGKIASSFYIAMEYIDGHDLKTILRQGEARSQPMSLDLALFITSKVASALDYAHRKRDFDEKEMGLVHRDVSPQNILISHEGDIKLCDFGIAKAASKASHTQAGALKGKLQYMSPEQAWGRKIDRRSDIFALATVMFELLTARKLFSGENEISVLEQVREARVVPPSSINEEITPAIDAVVLKALHKDPDARYQTAGELAKDLDSILYSLRPTPTSADLAIYMHRIYSAEEVPAETVVVEQPAVDLHVTQSPPAISNIQELALPKVIARPEPVRSAVPAETAVPVATAAHAHEVSFVPPAESRKMPIVPLAIAAVLALAIGGFFVLRSRSSPASASSQVKAVAPAGRTATTPVAANQPTALTGTPLSAAGTGTAPAGSPASTSVQALTASVAASNPQMDQVRVDQEVERRLTAERTRLESQRAQQAERARQEQLAREENARQQRLEQQVAQPTAPPAATQTGAPSSATATQPSERIPDAAPVQPAQTQAQEAPVRQGDLVEVGTPGLVPPELVKMRLPLYPPLAKAQRVEGLVVISALIAEDGKVLDVRLLRGVTQKVGINEAAIQAVRTSTFRPATKDGIRVKAYKTVTIPFRL